VFPGLLAVCGTNGRFSDFIQLILADAVVIVEEITSNDNMRNTRKNDFSNALHISFMHKK